MYRKYRHYKKRYYRESPLLDDFFDVIIGLGVLLGKLLFKLIIKLSAFLFNKSKKMIGDFKVNKFQPDNIEIKNINYISDVDEIVTISEPVIKEKQSNDDKKYQLKKSLLTQAEQNFLEVLKEIVGDKYIIQSQVPLYQIVTPTSDNYTDFNRIRAKTIDFVLYYKEYSPYLVIELDDSSHLRWDRIKRDEFVNELMKSVSLRIIRIPVSYHYNIEKLKNQIFIG